VTDYFQMSYVSMGGQLSVVFAAGRIEVAWEPTTPEPAGPGAPAMVSIGPLLQQRRFDEARPLLETLLQLQPEHPAPSTTLASSPAKRAGWRRPGCCCAGR